MSEEVTKKLLWDGRQESVKLIIDNLRMYGEHLRENAYFLCVVDLSLVAAQLYDDPRQPAEIMIKQRLTKLTRNVQYARPGRKDLTIERELGMIHQLVVQYARPLLMPTDSTAKRRWSIARFKES